MAIRSMKALCKRSPFTRKCKNTLHAHGWTSCTVAKLVRNPTGIIAYPESKSRNILQLHHLRGSICRWTFVPESLLFPLAVLKQGTGPNTHELSQTAPGNGIHYTTVLHFSEKKGIWMLIQKNNWWGWLH